MWHTCVLPGCPWMGAPWIGTCGRVRVGACFMDLLHGQCPSQCGGPSLTCGGRCWVPCQMWGLSVHYGWRPSSGMRCLSVPTKKARAPALSAGDLPRWQPIAGVCDGAATGGCRIPTGWYGPIASGPGPRMVRQRANPTLAQVWESLLGASSGRASPAQPPNTPHGHHVGDHVNVEIHH